MSNRKQTAMGVSSDSATTQENLNVLYTAHQVHTMAQFVYRHLSGAWRNQNPWSQHAGAGYAAPFAAAAAPGAGFGLPGAIPGLMPGPVPTFQAAPPALFYWYP